MKITPNLYLNYLKCFKLLKYNILNNEENENLLYENDLKSLFKNLLKNEKYSFDLEFNYNNLSTTIDLIKKTKDKIDLILISDSATIKKSFIYKMSFSRYVLLILGYKIDKCFVWHINKKYILDGTLDIDELCIKKDITKDVLQKSYNIHKQIENIKKVNLFKKKINIGEFCYKFKDCHLLSECMSHIPKYSVFNVSRLARKDKFSLYKNKIISFKELEDYPLLKDSQKLQINAQLYQKSTINKEKIKEFLDEIIFPIYYIDFEAYQEPIPRFDGFRSYEQTAFSYSIHIEYENGDIKHKEFISKIDENPKESLSTAINKDIKDEGTYIAYNIDFEKYVLKKLSSYNEELSKKIININERFKDLAYIFKNHYYYLPLMDGSHSIKKVLPAIFPNDEHYTSLNLVQSGYDAMHSYLKLKNLKTKNEKEEIINALKKYCEMDTFSMIRIIKHLKSL
jgi:hypothetical protein